MVWNDGLTPTSTLATVFDPRSQAWSEVTPLESDSQNAYGFASLAFNSKGEAFAVVGTSIAAWNRFDGAAWDTASSTNIGETRACALANDGTAMTFWSAVVGNESRVFAQSLSPTNDWSAVQTLARGAGIGFGGVANYGSSFVAYYHADDDKAYYSRRYEPSRGWLSPERITNVDTSYGAIGRGDAAPMFIWSDADRATASLFDGTSWTSDDLGPLYGGVYGSTGPRGHIAIWRDHESVFASRYDLSEGWSAALKLGTSDKQEAYVPGEVDAEGNALVAWANGSDITWRRAMRGARAWVEGMPIQDQDGYQVYTAINSSSGEVMLVWSNPLGVWASRFE